MKHPEKNTNRNERRMRADYKKRNYCSKPGGIYLLTGNQLFSFYIGGIGTGKFRPIEKDH